MFLIVLRHVASRSQRSFAVPTHAARMALTLHAAQTADMTPNTMQQKLQSKLPLSAPRQKTAAHTLSRASAFGGRFIGNGQQERLPYLDGHCRKIPGYGLSQLSVRPALSRNVLQEEGAPERSSSTRRTRSVYTTHSGLTHSRAARTG